ncbi:NADH dehydrogenase [ubiquinone] 1 alpha subcomplex assembly factor 2 isoform 2-T2 [Amazona ochrocephala]
MRRAWGLKWQRHIIPERRFVEPINRQAYQYETGDFPTEWEGAERCETETSGIVLPCDRSKAWQSRRYFVESNPLNSEAWIRKKRKNPPTIEEILKNESYREEMKQKIKDISEKDKLLQAQGYKEGLVAEPAHTHVKGHASAPYYGKEEPSQDPTSTANTFQPGSWMPPSSDSSHNK